MGKLWAGRFVTDVAPNVLQYTQTVDVDVRLVASDIWNSLAHVLMLSRQRIISQAHGRAIIEALLDLETLAAHGELYLDPALEDVHLNIETMLIDRLGMGIGGRVHTARSRNDQVVTDTRLYLRENILEVQEELLDLGVDLLHLADAYVETVWPGYTHGQPAQPISLAYWLSAYASAFTRDVQRLAGAYATTNLNPLGSCALAGTSFPIDRDLTTRLLGFDRPLLHGLDATSTRDFVIEAIAALSIVMVNISKMAEELVIWSSFEFGLVDVSDTYATGSSIMPQKKNPVVAELVRARSGRAFGALVHVLTMAKAVPMGYSCDLQDDKPPLWEALDHCVANISVMRGQINALTFHTARAAELCEVNYSAATELANFLCTERDMPFREAHRIVGNVVSMLVSAHTSLRDTGAVHSALASLDVDISAATLETLLDPASAMARQLSAGGTAPTSVREMLSALTEEFNTWREQVGQKAMAIEAAHKQTIECARQFIGGTDIDAVLA